MFFPSDKGNNKDKHKAENWLSKVWYNYNSNDYELVEYINDVNREYAEVLVEQNFCGKAETSYVYGVDRLSADNYWGLSTYYLYDGRGSVTGLTGEKVGYTSPIVTALPVKSPSVHRSTKMSIPTTVNPTTRTLKAST